MDRVIGIDGGGTRTRCVLASTDGSVLGTSEAGASNYRRVGLDAAIANVEKAVRQTAADAGEPLPVAFGAFCIAGAGMPDARGVVDPELRRLGLARDLFVTNDAAAAHAGAHILRPGVVVIAGTGSVVLGRNERGREALGNGWGPLLGDDGSGYWIGLQALRAVVRAADGRGDPTALTAAVLESFSARNERDLVTALPLDSTNSRQVAGVAEICAAAAHEGDPVAVEIMRQAGIELARSCLATVRVLEMQDECAVAMSGSVFSCPIVRESFENELSRSGPGVSVMSAALPPVLGAVLLALRIAGIEPDQNVIEKLRTSHRRLAE